MENRTPTATLKFNEDLATMPPRKVAALADMLAAIACEITKGEHRGCSVHELEVADA